MPLAALGPRICIMGPSNSGKSTLAQAIGTAYGLPVVHLDRLHHRPHTDWQPRPEAEFLALHDAAIEAERWVMDGNYTRCLPQRLARATGVILLDVPTLTSLGRYLARCWSAGARIGGLEGGRDSVKWAMLYHIAVTTRQPPPLSRHRRYRRPPGRPAGLAPRDQRLLSRRRAQATAVRRSSGSVTAGRHLNPGRASR